MDYLEAQAVLDTSQAETWWIRKGFHNGREIYKGVVYLNGKCSYSELFTGNDLIIFCNKNSSIPNLEELRDKNLEIFQPKKVEKINMIQSNHMFFCSSSIYCKTVFNEESKGSLETAHKMDALEAKSVLGRMKKTWWIREGFSNNQTISKGIIYVNGVCSYHPLLTENDWIAFFDKNSSIPDLKTFQKEKGEKTKTTLHECIFFYSSSTYCQTVFNEEHKGSLKKALRMDALEAQAVLRTVNGKTWWIREGFYNNQKICKGIVYVDGICSYHPLLTENDWIAFFDKNSSTLDLKTLQKKNIEKINMIQTNHTFFCSSSIYCRIVYNEESKGSLETAHKMDVLEAQTVLDLANKKTWWIREGFHNNQRICKGIVYVNGTCSYHLLLTDDDWLTFFDKKSSILDLKTLKRTK